MRNRLLKSFALFALLATVFAGCKEDEPTYMVQVTATEGGTIEGQNGEYKEGETVVFTAVPAEGYYFTKWSDGNTENPREIEISALSTVEPYTATFKSSTPTALEGTDAEEPRVRKVMIEDKLYIIYGDKMYDARGVLVQ